MSPSVTCQLQVTIKPVSHLLTARLHRATSIGGLQFSRHKTFHHHDTTLIAHWAITNYFSIGLEASGPMGYDGKAVLNFEFPVRTGTCLQMIIGAGSGIELLRRFMSQYMREICTACSDSSIHFVYKPCRTAFCTTFPSKLDHVSLAIKGNGTASVSKGRPSHGLLNCNTTKVTLMHISRHSRLNNIQT